MMNCIFEFPATKQCISKVIYKLFPTVTLKRKDLKDRSKKNFFLNLQMKNRPGNALESVGVENVKFPDSWKVSTADINNIIIEIPTEWEVNDNPVWKVLKITGNTFSLYIHNKEVDLKFLGIANSFVWSQMFCDSLHKILLSLKLCIGHPQERYSDIDKKGCKCVVWNNIASQERLSNILSNKCDNIVPVTSLTEACRKCIYYLGNITKYENKKSKKLINDKKCNENEMNDNESDSESDSDEVNVDEITLNDDLHSDFMDILNKIMPSCSPEFKVLLESQIKNSSDTKDPRFRRWNPDVISICLTMYSRSPKAYADLKQSNSLILPSGRLLRYYKNSVSQQPGFVNENLQWMLKEADRKGIPASGRRGGLQLDEMQIQDDLQVCLELAIVNTIHL